MNYHSQFGIGVKKKFFFWQIGNKWREKDTDFKTLFTVSIIQITCDFFVPLIHKIFANFEILRVLFLPFVCNCFPQSVLRLFFEYLAVWLWIGYLTNLCKTKKLAPSRGYGRFIVTLLLVNATTSSSSIGCKFWHFIVVISNINFNSHLLLCVLLRNTHALSRSI